MRNVSLGGRQNVGKVASIVIVINKRFVINMIMFIEVFAQCSNRGSAHFFLYKYFRCGLLSFIS